MKLPSALSLGLAVLLLCSMFAWLAGAQSRSESENPSSQDRAAIVAILEEIILCQERVVEGQRLSFRAGESARLLPAEVDLAKVRLQLAKEQGETEQMMVLLQEMVKLHEREVDLQRQRAKAGQSTAIDVTKAQIGWLKARLRLARARADEES